MQRRRSTPRKNKALIESIESRLLLSGAIPHLLKDINLIPTRPSGHIENLTVFNDEVYFTATDGVHGVELWHSNGLAGGTSMVTDIYVGPDSSSPSNLVVMGDSLYFAANDGVHGTELWKTDGTDTVMVANINTTPGTGSTDVGSSPNGMVVSNDVLYFQANDGVVGAELWRSDGTTLGTFLVADINTQAGTLPGTNLGSSPRNLIAYNNQVVFRADDGVTGTELWKADSFNATQIADLNPGSASSVNSSFAIVNSLGTLYFTAHNATSGVELFKSFGTAETTVIVDVDNQGHAGQGILYGSGSAIPTTAQLIADGVGGAYFTASDGSHGFEPWHTNGVINDPNGTYMIKDVAPNIASSNPTGFTVVGTKLYFAATNGVQNVYAAMNPVYDKVGVELWVSDGKKFENGGTTSLVKNIRPDPVLPTSTSTTVATLSSNPSNLFVFNDQLYFTADDGTHGIELWTTDGTESGTLIVENIRPEANPDPNIEPHPWSPSSTPVGFVVLNDTIFFQADDGVHGGELWTSDGTITEDENDGTSLVKDIYLGTDNLSFESSPSRFAQINGTLYFTGTFGNGSVGLWKTDGTVAGTILLLDAGPSTTTSPANAITNLTAVGSTLFFTAWDPVHGFELWKSDGTPETTFMLTNIRADPTPTEQNPHPAPNSSSPANFISFNGFLYFTATDGISGVEVWRSDGNGTTERVSDIWSGSGSSSPNQFTVVGSNLFFVASDSTHGAELWKLGTSGSPTMVVDANVGISSGLDTTNSYLTAVDSQLFYRANNGADGWELWMTDGTSFGTHNFNINPGSASSNPVAITSFNGAAYFYANDGIHGNELWRCLISNLTPELVYDINQTAGAPIIVGETQTPTTLGSSDTSLFMTVLGSKLIFAANDGEHGTELWVLDTSGNHPTQLSTQEINPSTGITYFSRPTIYNNALYFIVDDGVHGRELYSTNGTAAPTLVSDIRPGTLGAFDSNGPFLVAGDNLFFIANDGVHGAEIFRFNNTDASSPTTTANYDFDHGTIVITFSEDVSESLDPADVKVQLAAGGPIFSPDSFVYDALTNTATFSFVNLIPDGNYKFTVAANDVQDESGNPLAAPINAEFWTLGGDANRDRKVDAADLQILQAHWQAQSGQVFSTADFNFDGKVDITDLYILINNYQKTLLPPAPPAQPVSLPIRAPAKRTPTRIIDVVP